MPTQDRAPDEAQAKPDKAHAAPGGEYVCLVPIDHNADHCIYPPGAVIRLDHLDQAAIGLLIARGYVRPKAK